MGHAEHIHRNLTALCVITFLAILFTDSGSSFAYTRGSGAVSDSYYIAAFAKNIATGNGWATWNGDSWLPLDLHISTGPVVFLPLAVLLVLGVPPEMSIAYAALAINAALLLLLLRQWAKLIPGKKILPAVILVLLFFLCFQRYQWYLCLGETACTLLLLISVSCLAIDSGSPKSLMLAGIAAGAAMSSKLLGIFTVIAIPMYLIFSDSWKGYPLKQKAILTTSWFGGTLCAPLLTMAGLLGIYPASTLLEKTSRYLGLYTTEHGGIPLNPAQWIARSVLETPFWNYLHLKSVWPTAVSGTLVLLLSVLPLAIASRFRKPQSPAEHFISLTGFLALVYIAWFYFLGLHQQPRYFYIGGSLSFIALAWAVNGATKQWQHKAGFLTLATITATLGFPWTKADEGHAYINDMKSMANVINQQEDVQEIVWITQGQHPWPFLSYYLKPGIRWLHLRHALEEYSTFDQPRYLAQLGEDEKKNLEASGMPAESFFLANLKQNSLYGHFHWEGKDKMLVLLAKGDGENPGKSPAYCEISLAENNYFLLTLCSPKEIEKAISGLIGSNQIIIDARPANADH